MTGISKLFAQPAKTVSIVVAAVFSISSSAAGATCGLCDTEIVINSDLATCFLERYDEFAQTEDPAIIIDLSDCESRGIVDPLPSANLEVDEPDTQFMISPNHLDCLRKKLEDPEIELDPSVTIDLSSCI